MAKTPKITHDVSSRTYTITEEALEDSRYKIASWPPITSGSPAGYTSTSSGIYFYPPMPTEATSSQAVDAFLDAEIIPSKGGFMLLSNGQISFIGKAGYTGEVTYHTGMQSMGKIRDILQFLSEKSLEK